MPISISTLLLLLILTTFSQSDNDEILELFRGRCIRCNQPAVTVHEIVPRSYGKIAYKAENRVSLCNKCHNYIHQHGAINFKDELTQLRKDFLEKYA